MASLAESSAASLTLAQLAQLQERLLQQPEPRPATTPVSGVAASANASKQVSTDVAASIPESADASRTPHPSANPPPRIVASKSASAAEMEMMANLSSSQEAFVAMTRASSFHGYPGGDTQPMESQVYRDFNASMLKSSPARPPARAVLPLSPNAQANTYDTPGMEKTPKAFVEGDAGFVDLEDVAPSPGAQSTSSFAHELQTSPQTHFEAETRPGVSVFAMPETPALAGRKRRRSGELPTSAAETQKQLLFSQLFGGVHTGALLSNTQAFNQTQAPSSPLPDGPRSDPVITRPSPTVQNRFATSSPVMVMSSPYPSVRPSTAGEPKNRYTSMRESQERRAVRGRIQLSVPRDIDDDLFPEDDEEEVDAERRRFDNQRLQKEKSDRAFLEFSRVRAPSRQSSRPASSPTAAPLIDLTTPATAKKDEFLDFELSDDDEQAADASENELLEEDEAADLSNDEYDELGQTVLRSQGSEQQDDTEDTSKEEADDMENDAAGVSNIVEGIPPRTQHSAVADSQPVQHEQSPLLAGPRMQPPSSISSFVPGSQYTGKTSQDQAQLLRKVYEIPRKPAVPSEDQASVRPPSSSPLPTRGSTGNAAPAAEQVKRPINRQIEIPESDLLMSDLEAGDLRPVSASGRIENEIPNPPTFSTAQTHLSQPGRLSCKSGSLASPLKLVASQQTNNGSQSPLTAAGVRRFSDLAENQTPPVESNETDVNVEALMDDFMTADDREFIEAISTPPEGHPPKRRKVTKPNTEAAVDGCLARRSPPEQVSLVEREDQSRHPEAEEFGALKVPAIEPVDPPSTAPLQESLSKANEMLAATPESVKIREEAGAKVVSQLISARRPQIDKQSKGKSQRKTGTRKTKSKEARKAPKANEKRRQAPNDGINVIGNPVMEQKAVELQVVARNRVFALFKGQYNNFYAATWLGSSPDGSAHHVRFDDGTPIHIEPQHIRRLEICEGDQVKINVAGMRSTTWIVKGFGAVLQAKGQEESETDVFGRSRLQVQAKSSGRNGILSSTAAVEEEGELVDVAVSDVYLTHTMWPQFADRRFVPQSVTASINSRAATPSTGGLTPNAETPNSRSRRHQIQYGKPTNGRSSFLRDETLFPFDLVAGVGLFSGMAFAISYSSNENEKLEVARLIQRHGGIILENGFDELFELPNFIDASTNSPTKKSPQRDVGRNAATSSLQLHSDYQHLGFVALIADRHSRRAKYMQALALEIPTLSGRWILDSLESTRNSSLSSTDARPLSWAKYLLPAGESSFLNGATRSRTIAEYAAKDASLSTILDNRSLLLNGEGVLIVAPKKAKGTWERRKAYAFLTLALGAGQVRRVADAQEAKHLITEKPEKWKWIYVDGSVAEAGSIVLGKGGADGAKRKRDSESGKHDASAMIMSDESVNIVNDEFVVQSLILGALVD